MKTKGKCVTIKKVTDTKFNGQHPNGIDAGYERTGIAASDLTVGQSFFVEDEASYFRTSSVTKVNDDGTFDTENSVYEIEIHDGESIETGS